MIDLAGYFNSLASILKLNLDLFMISITNKEKSAKRLMHFNNHLKLDEKNKLKGAQKQKENKIFFFSITYVV